MLIKIVWGGVNTILSCFEYNFIPFIVLKLIIINYTKSLGFCKTQPWRPKK